MPRRPSLALTDAELSIMRVLWVRGQATVGEVVDELDRSPKPAYNTVLTMLRILEDKGFVTHEKTGRAFTYVPVVGEHEARRTALSHLLARFFDNSPERLMLSLLGRDKAAPAEIERLRVLIDAVPDSTPPGSGQR
jgi:predicted transcriptional regulator